MSAGDDHGYGGERGYGRPGARDGGPAGQTRTRLPESESAPYGSTRRPAQRSSRSLVTVVGVVVVLVAAIAFANRGGGDSGSAADDRKPATSPTSATGKRPVSSTSQSGVPSGFAHDEQGAQSAAANYAVALGSADMFDKADRDGILEEIAAASKVDDFKNRYDRTYSPAFEAAVGLNEDGSAPDGFTFVSRTSPIGTKATAFSADRATVSVWCGGLLGLAGEKSNTPVTSSWFTISMTLQWTANDWKIVDQSQKEGPAPVPGDNRASSADEIAKAVEGYGGFTYAR